MTLILLLLVSVCGSCFGSSAIPKYGHNLFAENVGETNETFVARLPSTVIPVIYKLKISPNLTNFLFSGNVLIQILVKSSTTNILLHSKGLTINKVNVDKLGREIPLNYNLNIKSELLNISLDRELVVNNVYNIYIEFNGTLSNDMHGFYRSSYKVGNVTKWLATTQFESTHARRAFPCFDEPQFRAIFDITVGRLWYQKVESNMRIKNSTKDLVNKDIIWDSFEISKPMATYLVAFIVSEFSYIQNPAHNFSVWARENIIDDCKYILKKGYELLKTTERYLEVPYDLPKMTIAAIPDFSAGAMENWGLTTYRERYVVMDHNRSTSLNGEYVTLVVAHEFAHQWFGDAVTPAWWDYLWLNEGFATFFEYYTPDKLSPEWRMGEKFVHSVLQYSLSVDNINVHHPMTTRVSTPGEINGLFDDISYEKAASVIRMLKYILSPETFRKSLKTYLQRGISQSQGTVVPNSLWEACEDQIYYDNKILPTSVKEIMKSWTERSGYPLVTVRTSNRNVIFEQSTYNSSRSRKPISSNVDGWFIPITYTKKSTPRFENNTISWLVPSEKLVHNDTLGSDEWILCNIRQIGYYRVNYDSKNWNLLARQLQSDHKTINVLNRAQLVDDSRNMALDGIVSFEYYFKTLLYLTNEEDPIQWFVVIDALRYDYRRYEYLSVGPALKDFFLQLIKPHFLRVGFIVKAADDHSTKTLRTLFIALACDLGLSNCTQPAELMYRTHKHSMHPDVRYAIYCSVLKNGNITDAVWSDLWNVYQNSPSPIEKEHILSVLGCANSQRILKSYLKKILNDSDDSIPQGNHIFVLRSIGSTATGIDATLELINDLLLNNVSTLSKTAYNTLHRLVWNLSGKITSDRQLNTLEKLSKDASKLDQTLHKGLTNTIADAYGSAVKYLKQIKEQEADFKKSLLNVVGQPDQPTTSTKAPSITTRRPSSGVYHAPTSVLYCALAAISFYSYSFD